MGTQIDIGEVREEILESFEIRTLAHITMTRYYFQR